MRACRQRVLTVLVRKTSSSPSAGEVSWNGSAGSARMAVAGTSGRRAPARTRRFQMYTRSAMMVTEPISSHNPLMIPDLNMVIRFQKTRPERLKCAQSWGENTVLRLRESRPFSLYRSVLPILFKKNDSILLCDDLLEATEFVQSSALTPRLWDPVFLNIGLTWPPQVSNLLLFGTSGLKCV